VVKIGSPEEHLSSNANLTYGIGQGLGHDWQVKNSGEDRTLNGPIVKRISEEIAASVFMHKGQGVD